MANLTFSYTISWGGSELIITAPVFVGCILISSDPAVGVVLVGVAVTVTVSVTGVEAETLADSSYSSPVCHESGRSPLRWPLRCRLPSWAMI